ncbi:hypothetical protein [Lysobacter gummosus]|uniref:hypothetical protein n=1 Tax=Lysobacter gummosus TaxID=262324 RepID=UPI0036328AD7
MPVHPVEHAPMRIERQQSHRVESFKGVARDGARAGPGRVRIADTGGIRLTLKHFSVGSGSDQADLRSIGLHRGISLYPLGYILCRGPGVSEGATGDVGGDRGLGVRGRRRGARAAFGSFVRRRFRSVRTKSTGAEAPSRKKPRSLRSLCGRELQPRCFPLRSRCIQPHREALSSRELRARARAQPPKPSELRLINGAVPLSMAALCANVRGRIRLK